MIRRILVPIDGSECADKALDYALYLADKCDASVEIFTAVSIVHIPILKPAAVAVKAVTPSLFESLFKEVRDHNEQMLSEAIEKARKAKPGLDITKNLAEGRPADRIVERAEEGGFDLIVMGSRGLGGVKEFFLGSVANRVASEAPCPVLLVR